MSSGILKNFPKECWPRYGRLIAPQAVFVMVAAVFAILEHNKNEGLPTLHWVLAAMFIVFTGVSHWIAKSICSNSNIGEKTLLATNGWIVLVMIGLTVYIILYIINRGGGHGSVVKKQQPKVKISEGVSPATQNSTTGAATQNSTTGAANQNSTTGAAKANNGYLGRNPRRVCAHLQAGEALVDECNDDNDDWLSPMEQKNCEGKGLGAYLD